MSLFISFEGGEGVGKSALLKGLSQLLSSHKPILTREPGGTVISDQIRQIFTHSPAEEPLTKTTEFMLLSAARSQHVTYKIKPALDSGKIVISDRYADSSRVYQGLVGGLARDFIEAVIAETTQGIEPNITFLLDCPPHTSSQRRHQRVDIDAISRFDNASTAFHQRIREAYLKLADTFPSRIVVINTEEPIDACLKKIQQQIAHFLPGV